MYCISSYLELLDRIVNLILSVEFINVYETVHTHTPQSHDASQSIPESCVIGGDVANVVQPDDFVFAAQKITPASDQSSPSTCSTSTSNHQK